METLNHLCNEFLTDTRKERLILEIVDHIEAITHRVTSDPSWNTGIAQLSQISWVAIEQYPRTQTEKVISWVLLVFAFPIVVVLARRQDDILEVVKEKTRYSDPNRKNARKEVLEAVSQALQVSIKMLDRME